MELPTDKVYFRINTPTGVKRGDSIVAAMLLDAMRQGKNIELPGVMSRRLYWNLDKIQSKYIAMYPELKRIIVKAGVKSEACFFTGGVDSFYTVLKNSGNISQLVYVKGFDIRLKDEEESNMVSGRLKEATNVLGKEYVESQTNFRDIVTDVPWTTQFGAALASVALCLPDVDKVYIPSSGNFPIHGSHPDVDPLWSTEAVEIIHHGAEVSRLDKVRYISSFHVVMQHLRVCWELPSTYNCGYCEKCVRTLTALYICGVIDKAESFPETTVAALANRIDLLRKPEGYVMSWHEENYDACPDGSVKQALKQLIS